MPEIRLHLSRLFRFRLRAVDSRKAAVPLYELMPRFGFLEWRDGYLKRQMHRHLQEAGAADGVLDEPELTVWRANISVRRRAILLRGIQRGIRKWCGIRRRIVEERVELDVVIRSIKTGVVENVESLDVELQPETFVDPKVLEDGHIDARLKGADENIAASCSESGFVDIASAGDRIARRNAVLARLQQRDAKRRAVEDRIAGIDA